MKNFIINKCLNYIKANTTYDEIKIREIEYGLVSIYLTISKLVIIFVFAFVLGIFKEMLIFSLLFNILRAPAFGLHATKSWICLLSSTIIFIGIPLICIYLKINIFVKIVICLIGVVLIIKNAPADTKKRPIVSKKRRLKFKIIATFITVIFSLVAIFINDNFISNCLIFSIILENCLISPTTYRIFKLPYNNYITYLKTHPDFAE